MKILFFILMINTAFADVHMNLSSKDYDAFYDEHDYEQNIEYLHENMTPDTMENDQQIDLNVLHRLHTATTWNEQKQEMENEENFDDDVISN